MDLSVIIVNWNTQEILARCLVSVYETVPDNQELEVIVADNASSDGSVVMVRRLFPQVHLIENSENLGFAQANNQALLHSMGRYVLLLNSDTEMKLGALETLVGFMDLYPNVGAVGGHLVNPDGTFQASYNDFPSLLGELSLASGLSRFFFSPYYPSHKPEDSLDVREVDWIPGSCLMVRREAIEQVGLLDVNYIMYTEETDWCYRLRQGGWKIYYLPQAQVVHHGGKSADRYSTRQLKLLYRSKVLFFFKHYGKVTAITLNTGIRIVTLIKIIMWSLSLPWFKESTRSLILRKIGAHLRVVFSSWEFGS